MSTAEETAASGSESDVTGAGGPEEGLRLGESDDEFLSSQKPNLVLSLCLRHKVPASRVVRTVAQALGVSANTVRRRFQDDQWTIEALEHLARYFGETVKIGFSGGEQQGFFFYDGGWLPCVFVRGAVQIVRRCGIVAYEENGHWRVCPSGNVPPEAMTYSVSSVTMTPDSAPARVAVLDDDATYATSLRESLVALGYDAQAFTTPEDLYERARVEKFDAYIIDWSLGEKGTAQALCEQLRAMDSEAMLILQTGQRQLSGEAENAFISAALALDLEPLDKPMRPKFLAARIERHLASRRRLVKHGHE